MDGAEEDSPPHHRDIRRAGPAEQPAYRIRSDRAGNIFRLTVGKRPPTMRARKPWTQDGLDQESDDRCGNMMKRRILPRPWTFASAVVFLVLASIDDGVSEEVRYQWRRTEFAFTTTGRYQRPWETWNYPSSSPARTMGRSESTDTGTGATPGRCDSCLQDPAAGPIGSMAMRRMPAWRAKQVPSPSPPAAGDNPLDRHGGILQVSSDRHYLTYSDGKPFFWLGDTWWLCPGDQVPIDTSTRPDCPSMFKALIDKRRQQGFTVVHMAFLGKGWTPRLDALIASRRRPGWNVDFWPAVDRYFDYANDAGLVPVVGMTWQIERHSLEDWKFIWRYFVARYGAHCVTWLVCGEYNLDQPGQAERIARVLALGAFIKECDPYKRAMTVHPWWHGGDRHQAWNEPWYDFIMLQGGHPGHGSVPPASIYRDAWAHGKPVIEGECNYEGIYGGLAGARGHRRRCPPHGMAGGAGRCLRLHLRRARTLASQRKCRGEDRPVGNFRSLVGSPPAARRGTAKPLAELL